MLIQIGTIAQRNQETGDFMESTPLYIEPNESQIEDIELFDNDVYDFLIRELNNYFVKKFS